MTTGRTFVAVDTVGAGEGEFVLIVQGSSARLTPETKNLPVDTVDHRHRRHASTSISKCVFNRKNETQ